MAVRGHPLWLAVGEVPVHGPDAEFAVDTEAVRMVDFRQLHFFSIFSNFFVIF